MVDVTLLEVNLEDASFDAHAPFSGRKKGSDADESEEAEVVESQETEEATAEEGESVEVAVEGEDEDTGAGLTPMLVGGALAVAAVLAWRRGRGSETAETDEEVVEVEV